MRLVRARVQNYRSIHDTGWFEVEGDKTVLVGPNEAGKTAVLRALQTVNMPPDEELGLDPLRDYPRSRFSEIDKEEVDLSEAPVATAVFTLDATDRATLGEHSPHLAGASELQLTRFYEGNRTFGFDDLPLYTTYRQIEKPLAVLKGQLVKTEEAEPVVASLAELTAAWKPATSLRGKRGAGLDKWLDSAAVFLDLQNERIDKAFDDVRAGARMDTEVKEAFRAIEPRIPFFVYFSQYFKVRPRIHLGRLAAQEAAGDVDLEYDFGNLCLLKLLGLSAAELAELGRGVPDVENDRYGNLVHPTSDEVKEYEDRLDKRGYRLNAASMTLTNSINAVWGEQRELDIHPDGQYLKVVVRNEDGARVELDQGSEGFRWLVSFYVVFEAQAKGDYANAVLLLDEPGMSPHALKQKQFRGAVTAISAKNQTIFSTHSPFMVGTEELDKVRIVEMKNREAGTKVHEGFAVDDPRSLFPLQAHLGYELGQTLFGQHRNLVVEGITDYWYLQAVIEAARDAGHATLDENVTVIPAGDAGKVVYHATVLHAQGLRVAALFDSDAAGVTAASNESLSHLMKPKQIIMVGSIYQGPVTRPELEDLLRHTLLKVAQVEMSLDASATASSQPERPVCDLLAEVGGGSFSKYRLGKAFIRWMRGHGWSDLRPEEQAALDRLLAAANKGTK